jgi:hypothetical protein
MSWIAVGDWAEDMSSKLKHQRRERLKVAAKHFGLDVLNILGDQELEEQLLVRFEATGLSWPLLTDEEENE